MLEGAPEGGVSARAVFTGVDTGQCFPEKDSIGPIARRALPEPHMLDVPKRHGPQDKGLSKPVPPHPRCPSETPDEPDDPAGPRRLLTVRLCAWLGVASLNQPRAQTGSALERLGPPFQDTLERAKSKWEKELGRFLSNLGRKWPGINVI